MSDQIAKAQAMAHDLDIRQFFRRAPRAWLERYLREHDALLDFDWNTVGVRNIDPLFEAWQGLDEGL